MNGWTIFGVILLILNSIFFVWNGVEGDYIFAFISAIGIYFAVDIVVKSFDRY